MSINSDALSLRLWVTWTRPIANVVCGIVKSANQHVWYGSQYSPPIGLGTCYTDSGGLVLNMGIFFHMNAFIVPKDLSGHIGTLPYLPQSHPHGFGIIGTSSFHVSCILGYPGQWIAATSDDFIFTKPLSEDADTISVLYVSLTTIQDYGTSRSIHEPSTCDKGPN